MPDLNPLERAARARQKRKAGHFVFVATVVAALAFAFLASGSSPVVAQQPVAPPAEAPDAEAGLEIFAERCANCHGPLGLGDGEQAAQLPRPPTALGSGDYVRQAEPAQLFDVVTNGILEAGMPPFGPGNSDPLSDVDRWNLVAAIYSLGQRQGLIDEGETLYEANCLACHGANGSGEDGAPDLGDQALWLERSDQDVFDRLTGDPIPEHADIDLDADALWAAIGYARSFSYTYADPLAAFAPIEEGTIRGVVLNESTGQAMPAGVPATLSAFTANFEPSLTMTTTLDAEGRFTFDLTMTPPDLVYVVTVQHEGISYGSDFGQLERGDPTLDLTVPVYDPSSDPSTISIEQLHIILQFGPGLVQISELYQFSQDANAVFVGASGDPSEGTVRLTLPDGATEPSFDRSFGGMESFFPADTVIQSEAGWADTVPVRPGPGSLSLLARYTLPYDQNLTIRHPLHYRVRNANLVMPDAGVSLTGDAWQEGEPQVMGNAGIFLNFRQTEIPAGETIQFSLQGEPRLTSPGGAASTPTRNRTNELLVGGGVLLLALAAGLYTVRVWRRHEAPDDVFVAHSEGETMPGDGASSPDVAATSSESADRRQALLQAIAALDDAYEADEVPEDDYVARRQALKDELVAIW